MTASEFSFLALGLILGAVSGAAVVELIRARPPSPREVRVTVAHDAIPRRSSTLADDAFVAVGREPARGGPADRREAPATAAANGPERRTAVRYAEPTAAPSMAGAIPITPDANEPPMPGRIMEPAMPLTGIPPARETTAKPPGPEPGPEMIATPISPGDNPMMAALVASIAAAEARAATGRIQPLPGADPEPLAPPFAAAAPDAAAAPVALLTAVGLLDQPTPPGTGPDTDADAGPAATERCAEERRIADERCEIATRARAQADAASDAMRVAQRTYDAHEAAAVTAAWRADPRAVHEAKDAAQGGFRAAVAAATGPDLLEAAARDWLNEINRINTDAREAQTTVAREHAAAAEIGARLERLGLEADAARIGAENADAACLAARTAVADCDERATSEANPPLIAPAPIDETDRLDEDETLGLALEAGGTPRIFRLLRGDRAAMTTIVAALADNDADAKRHWQLLMTGLVEAVVADAIEASALDFPEEHPFWGAFTRVQSRDIVRALGSLGYRFDALGGWMDDRQPSQRDLSLALGYAGLDPMRIRQWPDEAAMTALFADVTVAADEWLASAAGDLTLAEMVGMLGRRADGLAEVWNQWGRIRPLLLDEA